MASLRSQPVEMYAFGMTHEFQLFWSKRISICAVENEGTSAMYLHALATARDKVSVKETQPHHIETSSKPTFIAIIRGPPGTRVIRRCIAYLLSAIPS